MIAGGKHNLLGVRIDAVDYETAVARVHEAAVGRFPYLVSALAVHGVMTGFLDARHRFRLAGFDLLCPDGQPVRWAINALYGTGLKERVYGPELCLRICAMAATEKLPVFFYGSTPDVLKALTTRLRARYEDLVVAGCRASRFNNLQPAEIEETAQNIRASGARLVFIGLGCPRQEVWAYVFRDRLSMPLVAVGAAFQFHAGTLQQAPLWVQRSGLEWGFRLLHEPRRLWRRYLLLNPLYVTLVIMQMCGILKGKAAGIRPANDSPCPG